MYAFAVFGYVTAVLATYYVGRDAEDAEAELAGASQLSALQAEMTGLREEIRTLSRRLPDRERSFKGEQAGIVGEDGKKCLWFCNPCIAEGTIYL